MRAKITYFVTAAVLVVYFVLVGSRGVLLIRTGTPAHRHLRRGGADPAGHRRLVPLEEHPVRPQGQPARRRAGGRGRPARRRAGAHARAAASTATRPTRSSPGARPRPRTPRTTGAAGSASPSPTTTPATPRGPARRCSARSPCTTADRHRPDTAPRSGEPRMVRGRSAPADRPLSRTSGHAARPVLRRPGLDRVGRPVERLGPRQEVGVVVVSSGGSSCARSVRTSSSACPCTVRGSPSQRTGCCTVRTATTRSQGTVACLKKPTRRTPCALTQTPTRSSRSAQPMTSSATPKQTRRARQRRRPPR